MGLEVSVTATLLRKWKWSGDAVGTEHAFWGRGCWRSAVVSSLLRRPPYLDSTFDIGFLKICLRL